MNQILTSLPSPGLSADRALVIFSSLSPELRHLNAISASSHPTDQGRSLILTP